MVTWRVLLPPRTKCHWRTDWMAVLRNSSGPLITRASVTLPAESTVACNTTVPSMRPVCAAAGYATDGRCIRAAPPRSTLTPGPSATACGAAASGNVPVTNQHAAARMQRPAASAEMECFFDMRTSFRMDTTRCFRCRLRRNRGAGARSSLGGTPAMASRASTYSSRLWVIFDRRAIHHLLAGELNLAQQPPDGRMEPERGADDLFDQREKPVAPANVEALVGQDGGPDARIQIGKAGGE